MDKGKENLIGKSLNELQEIILGFGEKSFRAIQISEWLYRHGVSKIELMTNISRDLTTRLQEKYCIDLPSVITQVASNDGTIKFLLGLKDGFSIEVVRMKEEDHYTFCLSTQVGCALGCKFCATGLVGLKRNLSASEIIGSFIVSKQGLPADTTINIVFMGMGEPLLNYDALKKTISIMIDLHAFGIAQRRITVSTAGINGKIIDLRKNFPGIGIALSVNMLPPEKRDDLMPVNRKHPLSKFLTEIESLKFSKQNPVTIEYVLISNINDSKQQADLLGNMAKKYRFKVNIIPYNPIAEFNYERPSEERIESFISTLIKYKIPVTVRRSKGVESSAGCGQLYITSGTGDA
ncbi:MAG: 23S rRNA (adenine(2503)-C(2))-methyltransferase RlmN [Acidobacteria bacterium]|nr:23S rRNA (adenine(2503)-C(2))-methyltransferase RlmN [Acidobacteriota bacterium]